MDNRLQFSLMPISMTQTLNQILSPKLQSRISKSPIYLDMPCFPLVGSMAAKSKEISRVIRLKVSKARELAKVCITSLNLGRTVSDVRFCCLDM